MKKLTKEERIAKRLERKKNGKGFFREFKEFITNGNVMKLAIAVVMGVTFQAIINSLVNDMIMPLIGAIINVDISQGVVELRGGAMFKYGLFIQAVVNFFVIALTIFICIKLARHGSKVVDQTVKGIKDKMTGRRKSQLEEVKGEPSILDEPTPVQESKPEPTVEELLSEIRDLLKK
jgi:large conductance mechanosensitive channel